VHDPEKDGGDIAELDGARPWASRQPATSTPSSISRRLVVWHGVNWEPGIVARFLRAGTNVYTGMVGSAVPLAEDEELLAA
jgi:hypothetical protein